MGEDKDGTKKCQLRVTFFGEKREGNCRYLGLPKKEPSKRISSRHENNRYRHSFARVYKPNPPAKRENNLRGTAEKGGGGSNKTGYDNLAIEMRKRLGIAGIT